MMHINRKWYPDRCRLVALSFRFLATVAAAVIRRSLSANEDVEEKSPLERLGICRGPNVQPVASV